MKILKQSFWMLTPINEDEIIKQIERIARVCYKSEDKINKNSGKKLVANLVKNDHSAMLEHVYLSAQFVTNRAIANELVRHRQASYAQESTRYCNYSKGKFNSEISVIRPPFIERGTKIAEIWENSCKESENNYFKLLSQGLTAQEARGVLPLDLKTEIVITANIREWRHIFKVRCSPAAHPQMREMLEPVKRLFEKEMPTIFNLEV